MNIRWKYVYHYCPWCDEWGERWGAVAHRIRIGQRGMPPVESASVDVLMAFAQRESIATTALLRTEHLLHAWFPAL